MIEPSGVVGILSNLSERVERHGERITRIEERQKTDSEKIGEIRADVKSLVETKEQARVIVLEKRWERILEWGFKIGVILLFGKTFLG